MKEEKNSGIGLCRRFVLACRYGSISRVELCIGKLGQNVAGVARRGRALPRHPHGVEAVYKG